jgi:ABC-type transport system substrate-binding protein
LRADQPKLADPVVRKAILGLLNVELLAAVGAGSDNSVTLDQALVRAPSDPGYVATAPPPLSRDRALQLFTEAGYQVDRSVADAPAPTTTTPGPKPTPAEPTRGRITRDGETLSLAIGAAANDPTSVAVANTAADQLRSVGIAATVLPLEPQVLYGTALATNRIDAVVGWHAAGGDLATVLASRYSCPALVAAPVATSPGVPAPDAPGGETPTTSPSAAPETAPLVRAPSNLTGICDRAIQQRIDAALVGAQSIDDVITAVEPSLWAMSAVLPIMQDTTIVAAGPSVQNVSLTGAVPVGIVGDAARWTKTPS